jgi:acyl-CoA thioesterase-1
VVRCRRHSQLTLAGVVLSGLLLACAWPGAASPADARPTSPTPPPRPAGHLSSQHRCSEAPLRWRAHPVGPYRAEETYAGAGHHPLMVVVGGSFTAGVGAARPSLGWPYLLGRLLGWRVLGVGVPGAGYVAAGEGLAGPMRRELADAGLGRHHPGLVILQAGHNDIHAPPAALRRAVVRTVATVRRSWPSAAVVALTVFPKGPASPRARSTDRVIVQALKASDPSVLVLNPVTGHWRFPTVPDRLHPSPSGHLWIAQRVAAALVAHGLAQRRPASGASVRPQPLTPTQRLLAASHHRGRTGAGCRRPRAAFSAPKADRGLGRR